MEALGRLVPLSAQDIKVIDVTLRDGEQAAGVIFSRQEKLHIGRLLTEMGIHQFEVGCPWLCAEEARVVKAVAKDQGERAIGFCRAKMSDIHSAVQAGLKWVTISTSTSDRLIEKKFGRSREWVLEQMLNSVKQAKHLGLNAVVSAEDASRTDPGFLLEYYSQAFEAGASRVRFCDSTGVLTPLDTAKVIGDLVNHLGPNIEMHTHNDFGMATGNALAGLKGGAHYVTGSIGGLGERSGNAAIEEIVMALKIVDGIELPIATQQFRAAAEYVAEASARAIPIWKAIIGTNVFAHESGIHVDGVIKDPRTYEAFAPEEVGLQRQLLVGKHSGSHTVIHKFHNEFGIELSSEEAQAILTRARAMAVELKRALFSKELMLIYNDLKQNNKA